MNHQVYVTKTFIILRIYFIEESDPELFNFLPLIVHYLYRLPVWQKDMSMKTRSCEKSG